MAERKPVSQPVEVEVSTQEERERRERAERKEIERGQGVDWRSYRRRDIPGRWRA